MRSTDYFDGQQVADHPLPRFRRQRRKRPAESAVSHDRWLVSYADFITLLFAVFATMYALSAVDAGKYNAMAASLKQAFKTSQPGNVGDGGLSVLPGDGKSGFMSASTPEVGLDAVRAQLQSRLSLAIGANLVSVEADQRGLVVSLREAGSFAISSSDLSEAARIILGEVGAALSGVGNHVRIEGHTDDVPIHTERYASNWELSTARATSVVRFFMGEIGLSPQRMSAAGYAEYFPRVPNTTAEGRSRNRRVDIVILSPQVQASQEPTNPTVQSPAP